MSMSFELTQEEQHPRSQVKKIVEEFYQIPKGGEIRNESAKAAIILSYIQHLEAKYKKQGQPMEEEDIAALGFDIDALKQGKLRPAPLSADQ